MTETRLQDLNTPPYNLEAEEATLGSVLIDPESFWDAAHLEPKHFHTVMHGWIWDVFRALNDKNSAIDLLTVQSELQARGQLNEIGGAAYLTRLVTLTPTAYNISAYAALVIEAYVRRTGLQAASDIAKLMYDTSLDPLESLSEYSAYLDSLVPSSGSSVEAWDASQRWLEEKRAKLEGRSQVELTTGYATVNAETRGGMKREELILLAAEPSMGKSSLAFQMARRQAALGLKVGIFTQEMTLEDVIDIMACAELGLDSTALTLDDLARLERVASEIGQLPFMVNDISGLTVADVSRHCRDMKRALGGLDVVYIDHIGYMRHLGEKGETKTARIGNTTKGLMGLARKMKIAVCALCQLKRGDYDEENPPELDALRESGDLEADARQVWVLHRKSFYSAIDEQPPKNEPHKAHLIIRKNHKGPINVTADLWYTPLSRRFSETQHA